MAFLLLFMVEEHVANNSQIMLVSYKLSFFGNASAPEGIKSPGQRALLLTLSRINHVPILLGHSM